MSHGVGGLQAGSEEVRLNGRAEGFRHLRHPAGRAAPGGLSPGSGFSGFRTCPATRPGGSNPRSTLVLCRSEAAGLSEAKAADSEG